MQKFRVALLGLKSLFGQASSLLLKQCPNIYNLRLYDETDISVAHDLKIINTSCKVEAYQGKNHLNEAIKDSDIVLIGDDYLSTPVTGFDVMAPKMQDYAKAIAESSPNAVIIVAASPINKLVPVLSELLLENGYYDCNKILGSTAVDNIRANCVLASYVRTDSQKIFLPVIGGDTEETIVPLFSHAKPHFNISEDVLKRLVNEIKQAHSLIFELKGSSEALNKAYSTVKFVSSVMAGLKGEPNVMNIAFTKTSQVEGTEYFALPVLLGRFGVQARYGIPRTLPFENDLISEAVYNLKKDIDYAKLFCKSRDTAAEVCSRNVANRFQKSKEFENFVNDLKNTNSGKSEDILINKIKPPVPIEKGQLTIKPIEKSFDPAAFFSKNQHFISDKVSLIPPYIQSGASIAPSLIYTFQKKNGIIPKFPQSSAETPVCQPISSPQEKPLHYQNIVPFVENLVKQTTEKILNEQQKIKTVELNESKPKKYLHVVDPVQNDKNDLSKESLKGESLFSKLNQVVSCKSEDIEPKKTELDKLSERPNTMGNHIYLDRSKTNYNRKHAESIFKQSLNKFKTHNDDVLIENCLDGSLKPNHSDQKQPITCTHLKNKIFNKANAIPHFSTNKKINCNFFNDNSNRPIAKFDEYEKKLLASQDNGKSNEQANDSCKSKIIKRIIHILNDNPKEFDQNKKYGDNRINVCSSKSAVSMGPGIKEVSEKTKTKNLIDNISYKKIKKDIKTSEYAIINKNKAESLDNMITEKSTINVCKDEKNKYFNQRYKSQETFKKNFSIKNKSNNTIFKVKNKKIETNNIKNTQVEELYNFPIRDIITNEGFNRKPIDLVIKQNKRSESLESIDIEKLFSNITKRHKNVNSNQKMMSMKPNSKINGIVSHMENIKIPLDTNKTKTKIVRKVVGHPVELPINENSWINAVRLKQKQEVGQNHCRTPEITPVISGYSNVKNIQTNFKNEINEKPSTKPNLGTLNLKCSVNNTNQDRVRSLDNSTGTQTEINGNDLNNLLKILDHDVFKCNSALNENKFTQNRESKGTEKKENLVSEKDSYEKNIEKTEKTVPKELPIAQTETKMEECLCEEVEVSQEKGYVQTTMPKVNDITHDLKKNSHISEKDHLIDSDKGQSALAEEKGSSDNANQNQCKNVTSKAECLSNEEISKEINNEISNHSLLVEEKGLCSNENQNVHINMNLRSKVDSPCHNKKAELHFETPIRKIHHTLFPRLNEPKDMMTFSISEPNNVNNDSKNYKENISQSDIHYRALNNEKSFKENSIALCNQSSENEKKTNVKPKSSFTISERFINRKDNSNGKLKSELNENIFINYKKTLNKSKKLCNFHYDYKNSSNDIYNKSKSCNRIPTPESENQYNVCKHKIYSEAKVCASNSSKSFINATRKGHNCHKKDNISQVLLNISGQIGKKVHEINKTEHSLRIKDKNGIKNFFLIRGLLPKVDNKKKSINQKDNATLLKTKVSNEDPFMAIKGKAKLKNAQPFSTKNKSNSFDTIHEESKESDSLLITHNSVYSPKCPVHGHNYYLHNKQFENKSFSNVDSNFLSQKSSSTLNNLCRIRNKMNSNKRSSSPHSMRQKTPYFKLYSTSTQPRNRSPSHHLSTCKKNTSSYLPTKSNNIMPTATATLFKPSGFYQRQKISKILEQGVKKIVKSDTRKQTTKQTREWKVCSKKEENKTQPRFLTQPIVPFHIAGTNKPIKIEEQFFNMELGSSYAERTLKATPKFTGPSPSMTYVNSSETMEKPSISRVDTQSFNINWLVSQNKSHLTDEGLDSNEKGILGRGTCLEHVRNKFLSNSIACSSHSFNPSDDQKNTTLGSLDCDSISSAYTQYTKDFIKSEYNKSQKFPSIRQIHQSAFHKK